MTNDYLPKHATPIEACDWLLLQTGEKWTLARLLESGLMPWFWFDQTPGYRAIFGDRVEGYLAPMVFAGDTMRLEADGVEALVNFTHTHDGVLIEVKPGMRVPAVELKFKREDIHLLHEQLRGVAPMSSPNAAIPVQRSAAQDAAILAEIRARKFDPLVLPKNQPGKPGPKAEIRAALIDSPLFKGEVFDKAWERLRQRGDIVDKA